MIHGTRGFANQVTQTIVRNKNFFYSFEKKFIVSKDNMIYNFIDAHLNKNDHYKSDQLVNPVERKKLSEDVIARFRQKFYKDLGEEPVVTSPRCIVNKIKYHSISWSRNEKKNDHTICYNSDDESFGMIEYFFEFEKTCYAILNVLSFQENIDKIIKKPDRLINSKNFSHFFKLVDYKKVRKTIIRVNSIICKCLIINSEVGDFLTKVQYDYEHD